MKALLLSVALGLGANGTQPGAIPPWKEILGPAQGKLPASASITFTWRTNLAGALAEARQKNRPLFVTFRCLPCKQCADFDKEVLEGGLTLDPLLTQFITVRLTDAAAIDLGIFPVEGFADLDLSWWGWFLSPEGRVYGVFGGRDHVSDTTRISTRALIASMPGCLRITTTRVARSGTSMVLRLIRAARGNPRGSSPDTRAGSVMRMKVCRSKVASIAIR
jgi:hypothetical protein